MEHQLQGNNTERTPWDNTSMNSGVNQILSIGDSSPLISGEYKIVASDEEEPNKCKLWLQSFYKAFIANEAIINVLLTVAQSVKLELNILQQPNNNRPHTTNELYYLDYLVADTVFWQAQNSLVKLTIYVSFFYCDSLGKTFFPEYKERYKEQLNKYINFDLVNSRLDYLIDALLCISKLYFYECKSITYLYQQNHNNSNNVTITEICDLMQNLFLYICKYNYNKINSDTPNYTLFIKHLCYLYNKKFFSARVIEALKDTQWLPDTSVNNTKNLNNIALPTPLVQWCESTLTVYHNNKLQRFIPKFTNTSFAKKFSCDFIKMFLASVDHLNHLKEQLDKLHSMKFTEIQQCNYLLKLWLEKFNVLRYQCTGLQALIYDFLFYEIINCLHEYLRNEQHDIFIDVEQYKITITSGSTLEFLTDLYHQTILQASNTNNNISVKSWKNYFNNGDFILTTKLNYADLNIRIQRRDETVYDLYTQIQNTQRKITFIDCGRYFMINSKRYDFTSSAMFNTFTDLILNVLFVDQYYVALQWKY